MTNQHDQARRGAVSVAAAAGRHIAAGFPASHGGGGDLPAESMGAADRVRIAVAQTKAAGAET